MLVVRAVVRDDDDGGSAREPTATTEAPEDPGSTPTEAGPATSVDAGLARRTLRQEELPSGWFPVEGAPIEICPEGDPFGEVRPSASAQSAFAADRLGPFVTSVVAELPDEDRAGDLLEAVEEAIDDCATHERDGIRYEVEEIDGPDLGDEVVAARVTGTTEAGDVAGRIYFAREGRRVAAVALLTVDARPDEDLARDALEAVVGRL